VFTVGVSADVNSALIERLAVEGHGTAHFVRTGENVERPVSLLASRLTNPLLTNVRVTVDGVRLTQVLPAAPLDIFFGQDLVLLARYDGDGDANVRIEGQSATGRVSWNTRAQFGRRVTAKRLRAPALGSATHRLAGRGRSAVAGGNTEMDAEIKSLGEKYGIPTEFSSYLVVEPGMQTRLANRTRQDAAAAGNCRCVAGVSARAVRTRAVVRAVAPGGGAARCQVDRRSRFDVGAIRHAAGWRAPVRAAGEGVDGPALCFRHRRLFR
jgi:hypothetical protein